jgi:hypothetical protein
VDEPDKVRQVLWLRLKIVARNLGAAKLWTLEDAPFWSTVFQQANSDEIAALTAAFQDPEASWWTYEITDIAKVQRLATEQLAIWSAVNASENQDLQETVARVRTFAVVVLILFGTVVLSLVVYAVVRTPSSVLQRLLGR